MKPGLRLVAAALSLSLLPLAAPADPVVTDSRIINDDRRVAILEAKLASLRQQVALLEDAKAIERLQQAYGYYMSEGMGSEAAALFADNPAASIEYAQQGVYVGKKRIRDFLTHGSNTLKDGEIRENFVVRRDAPRAESALLIRQGLFQHARDGGRRKRLESKEMTARKQRRVHVKTRIVRRRADQPHVAFFHVRQQQILLGFVEAVNLVDEQHGAPATATLRTRFSNGLAQVLDPGEHRRQRNETGLRLPGEDAGQRRLPRPRTTPQDQRGQSPGALHKPPDKPIRPDEVRLADEFV